MEFRVENFQKRFICEICHRFLNLMQSEKNLKTNWKVRSTFHARWYKYTLEFQITIDILLIYGSYCFYDQIMWFTRNLIFKQEYLLWKIIMESHWAMLGENFMKLLHNDQIIHKENEWSKVFFHCFNENNKTEQKLSTWD